MVVLELNEYLNKDDVTREGTEVTFIDAGRFVSKQETGHEQDDFVIRVRTKNSLTKLWRMNKTSQRVVGAQYGYDTALWIGKTTSLFLANVMVEGKQKTAIFAKTNKKKESDSI